MADRYTLLVEGKDDEHVFYSLLEYHQVPELFAIRNMEGVDKLPDILRAELKASDLKRLGIVVDANTDLAARWQALQNILRDRDYDVPANPDPNGTIIQRPGPGQPEVGIWIMPDNKLSGILEDFVAFLVPPDDRPLWDYAGDCVQQIPEQHRHFKYTYQPKAHLHTWLAWQEEPGTPMGQAITKRYLDADAPHARQLIDWIRRLFDI